MPDTMFKRHVANTDFSSTNKLLFGFPKLGKTTLASFQKTDKKEPLFIMTEDGLASLEVLTQRVTSWQGFIKLKDLIVKNSKQIQQEHSCIVVDLVSDLDMWCADDIAKRFHVQHLSDLEYGKGWSLAKREFQSAMSGLLNTLPCTFIAHASEKEIIWQGEKLKTQSPSLGKGCLEYINGKVDSIMYISPTNHDYSEIQMKPSVSAIAGSRYPQLVRNFKYSPDNPSKTYNDIQQCFKKGEIK